ncbi:MAG: potassium-transporting ATPase subunit KdpA [Gemmatimonadetes bacterium]|nr:potassium-transporting ATPase subunit KdpA [Gemmatimonadota bacterium]
MTTHALAEFAVVVASVLLLALPLGTWIARVMEPGVRPLPLARVERAAWRLLRTTPEDDMHWSRYAGHILGLSVAAVLLLYALQRLQGVLPLGAGMPSVPPLLAFNTAVSFVTNTNWQAYAGEATLGLLVPMVGLTVQNFLSAAVGLAVLAALVRGLVRREASGVGNLWVDLVRGTLYVLLPLSFIIALLLAGQGVPQTLRATRTVTLVEPLAGTDTTVSTQTIPLGPVASQVAIKQLGTNGGGYYNANSAHPLENPTPFSNLVQVVSILLIPAALCLAFGRLVRAPRQGWALLTAMVVIYVGSTLPTLAAEQAGTPQLRSAGVELAASPTQPGGNMEGKEVRFGIAGSAIWATATTAASNGSVNAMHDSFTPLGGLFPMWLMQLGEVVFGGVGSGLYGMLVFALLAVFLAGLMVGRTPEYLGKKVEARDIKLAALVVLIPSAWVLLGTAVSLHVQGGRAGIFNAGPHGFSEVLYALSSAANNNGSAFGGLGANSAWYNTVLALAMWMGRFWIIVPVLALAGSFGGKRAVPPGAGTFPTDGPTFVLLLVATVLLVGALTFLPALALGPIVEQMQMIVGGAS